MPDTIHITARLRINCSPDRVREQYRDIDHHIRNDVHPSIHYEWQPSEPGERKIKTTFRILGLPHFDISLLEDCADGSFIIRYLEGTNAGMVLVHRFVEIEPGVTEVQLAAHAPSTLGRKILGPLFVVGARQVMKKALAEDKRDLEAGAFRPGLATGKVEDALASLAAQRHSSSAVKHAILEAACLISACDGSIDEAERDAVRRASIVLGATGPESDAGNILDRSLAFAEGEQIVVEIERIGTALGAAGVAREGVISAAVVALVSQGMSLGELEALRRVQRPTRPPFASAEPAIYAHQSRIQRSKYTSRAV